MKPEQEERAPALESLPLCSRIPAAGQWGGCRASWAGKALWKRSDSLQQDKGSYQRA